MNLNRKTHDMVRAALIAAVYTLLTFLFAPISFGAVQLRISEALSILPLFTPSAIPGLTIGCFLSNLIGAFSGACPIWDPFFGAAATLLASIATYYIGKISVPTLDYLLGPFPTVFFNGWIIGGEITLFFSDPSLLYLNVAMVTLGEGCVCYLLGIPLIILLRKHTLFQKSSDSQNPFDK